MPGQVPRAVVQERYERLVATVEEVAWAENRAQVGREVEVLVAEGEGRKDAATHRYSGRARDNRLVHVGVPDGAEAPRPGDLVTARVTYAAPHHLAAGPAVRRGRVRRSPRHAGDGRPPVSGALVLAVVREVAGPAAYAGGTRRSRASR
jgi:tRNA-2-methylthio-N6-dimethylallyladenosine synthase